MEQCGPSLDELYEFFNKVRPDRQPKATVVSESAPRRMARKLDLAVE